MAETNFKDALASFDGAQAAFAQGRFSDALNGFRQAAEQGHPVAPWALGTMYALGLGEARDDDLVRYWYERGADWGHSYGDDVSRQRKAEGIAIPDDAVVAWLVRAADHHAQAQYHLGRMYANAWGVARDFGAALALYRKAAEQGHTGAMRLMARMYFSGQGVPRSQSDGRLWKERADKADGTPGQI